MMVSEEDEKNVNQLLLEFSTMESDLRTYYLQRLITHLTAGERDLILRYFSSGTTPSSSGDTNNACTIKKEIKTEPQPDPPVMPVYKLPELMPTVKIEPQQHVQPQIQQHVQQHNVIHPQVQQQIQQVQQHVQQVQVQIQQQVLQQQQIQLQQQHLQQQQQMQPQQQLQVQQQQQLQQQQQQQLLQQQQQQIQQHQQIQQQQIQQQQKQQPQPQQQNKTENGLASATPVKVIAPLPDPPPLKRGKIVPSPTVKKQTTGMCSVCSGEDKNMQHTRTGWEVCRACEAFFTKHAGTLDSLVCRKDLSCRIIKKRKQAYCNYCRLKKCLVAGLTQDGVSLPTEPATSSTSPSQPPPSTEKHSSKKRKRPNKQETQTLISSEPYEQAAATLQSLIPDMVNQGLTSCLDDDTLTATVSQQNQLEAVGLNQVSFDPLSSIQIPKSLVIGGTGEDDELQSINFSHTLLKDSDIAITFDDEPDNDKKS